MLVCYMCVWIRGMLRMLFRVRVTGDVASLACGPALVVAHCESALDGVLLGLFLPGKPLVVTTPEMHAQPIPRFLLRWVHCLTIDPARPMAIKDVVHHVRDGGVAVIFPQGRVTTTGSVMKTYDAAAMIATRCGNAVVPVHVAGTLYSRYASTSGNWPKRLFPKATIAVHAPLSVMQPTQPDRRYALWFPRAAVPAVDPRQSAVVVYTSGSEGLPKAVVLSHAAILANMTQVRAVIDFGPDDKYFSALPLYHTFGLVACALMPLMTGTRLFLYVSPLRYRAIPELVYLSGATYLFGTSTFLGHYAVLYGFNYVRNVGHGVLGG